MSFVHLHAHSEFSLLDGLGKVKDIISRAQELEQPAIALTDHGAMHGCFNFYVTARKAGIKPILGMEAYLAPRGMEDKTSDKDREPSHLLLIAKNYQGYQNLMQLSTLSHLHGFYYKPRIDKEVLRKYADGLISSTGCPAGEIPRALRNNKYEEAQKLTREYIEIFGKENFFVEIQMHETNNTGGELYKILQTINPQLVKLAQEFGLKVVATNDVHYVNADDAEAQDILLAIQTKTTITDPNRKLSMLDSPDFYIKSQKEMLELFPENPIYIENSLAIADMVTDDYQIPMGKMIFPKFETPDGSLADDYLRRITYERLSEKYPNATTEITDRIEKELKIIKDKGFSTYVLIFADLANFCKESNILATARGSAAGSAVHYILDISYLDPLRFNIPFERFLNPERPTPPDVDLDMEDINRDKVIQYTIDKYGHDKVAQIVTFGSMESRAAIRDVGRVMALPYSFVDSIAKMIIPPKQGFHITIEDSLKQVPELNEMYTTNPEVKKLIDYAKKVQGVKRHAGVHAAGVIIADKPITEYVPLMQDRKTGKVVTQLDMYSLDLNAVDDALGLLKMDYLGLRNLSILNETVRLIKRHRGIDIDPYKIPLDEPKVFELLSNGDTTGVFQMESSGYRQVARDLKPNRLEDISVMMALYRPGPMDMIPDYIERKNNPNKIKYLHPTLKEVLADTYGIIVYQEQCMQIANVMAGYSLGRGDLLRRAIGKKKKDLMAKEKVAFIESAQKQGHTAKEATAVFEFIEKFAVYGFNRAHSASYGLLTYQTAYMKALYPYEFFTALLTCEHHNSEKIAIIINELKAKGINVLPPNINKSKTTFEIEELENGEQGIRFALTAIKNVGDSAVEGVVAEREKNGEFKSMIDLTQRVDSHLLNRKSLESYIYAGTLSDFGSRPSLIKVASEYLEAGSKYQKMKAIGQNSLFSFDQANPPTPQVSRITQLDEANEDQLLQWEKEVLGFYLTKHPHEDKMVKIRDVIKTSIGELEERDSGKNMVLGGFVEEKKEILTKKDGREMCFIKINDLTGSVEVIVFPDVYQNGARQIQTDSILIVQGKLDQQDDGSFKILASKLLLPEI